MQNMLAKQDLTSRELQMLSSEFEKRKKSTLVTWLLWFFLGGFGGHRYYLGKYGTGIAMTLTIGALGFWTFIDLFLINGMLNKKNEEIEAEILQEIKLMNQAKKNEEVAASKE